MKPCGAAKTTDAQFIANGSKENTDNNSDTVQSAQDRLRTHEQWWKKWVKPMAHYSLDSWVELWPRGVTWL